MAILKKVIQPKTAKPEALCEFPEPTCHQAGPEPFEHCPCPPKNEIHLCKDFDDAVSVCEQIYLAPGETHTEFYLVEEDGKKVYHCVIAVGNINAGKGHLYLTDTGSDSPISTQISNIVTKLGNVTVKVNEIYESVEALTTIVNEHTESIESINSAISTINKSLTVINASIGALDTRVSDLEEWAVLTDAELQVINGSIESTNASIEALKLRTSTLETRADQTDANIQIIDLSIAKLDSSVKDLDSRVVELEKLTPITDSSIKSLFHSPFEDAYTVNLCCYTEAGYVKVEDVSSEYKWRTADCVAENEYKTYNIGEHVILTAVANEGYKFVKWLKDETFDSSNSSIMLAFDKNRGDINVIGTLNDGIHGDTFERAPLANGYTALFKKLMTLKLSIDVSTKDGNVEYPNDSITVTINGEVKTGTSIYVEENDVVEIQANAADHHKFYYFEINDVQVKDKDGYYKFSIESNTTIEGFFEEVKYKIHGEPNVAAYGDVTINPHTEYVVEGTEVELEATPVDGYKFTKWVLDNNDPWHDDPEHADWSSTDNPINITAGDVAKDWDINAVFEKKLIDGEILKIELTESDKGTTSKTITDANGNDVYYRYSSIQSIDKEYVSVITGGTNTLSNIDLSGYTTITLTLDVNSNKSTEALILLDQDDNELLNASGNTGSYHTLTCNLLPDVTYINFMVDNCQKTRIKNITITAYQK